VSRFALHRQGQNSQVSTRCHDMPCRGVERVLPNSAGLGYRPAGLNVQPSTDSGKGLFRAPERPGFHPGRPMNGLDYASLAITSTEPGIGPTRTTTKTSTTSRMRSGRIRCPPAEVRVISPQSRARCGCRGPGAVDGERGC
jgi:hypothetical protein